MTTCKNCGTVSSGDYCSRCGQRTPIQRISWGEISHQLSHAFFHVQDGLPFTLKSLFLSPGNTIQSFLEGQRKKYYNPLLLLILLAGVGSLLFAHFHFETIIASIELEKLEAEKPLIAHKFFVGRLFFFCLVCSLGDYLIFREKKYNLPECLVSNAFIFSTIAAFQILYIPVLLAGRYWELGRLPGFLFLALTLAYLCWSRFQLYGAKDNFKLTATIVLAVILYFAIVLVVGIKLVQPSLGH